jgi:hypothetical protein
MQAMVVCTYLEIFSNSQKVQCHLVAVLNQVEQLREFHNVNYKYTDIVKEVLAFYVDDIPRQQLDSIVDQSFSQFLPQAGYDEVLPLVCELFSFSIRSMAHS